MSADLITLPFADQGDKTAVPTTDPSGFVNLTQGYTQDYEISLTSGDPKAKAVERAIQNYLFNLLTSNTQVWQQAGFPNWYSAMPGGYRKDAFVMRQQGDGSWKPYRSLVAGNITDPLASSTWQYVKNFAEIVAYVPMPAGGAAGAVEVISTATDFNTLTASATYEIKNDAVAASCANLGTSVSGMVEIKAWMDGANTNIIQRYTSRTGRTLARGAVNGAWSNWVTAASTAGDTFFGEVGISTVTGSVAQASFQTSGSARWKIGKSSDSETGSNAGANYNVSRYTDAGALIDTPFSINRQSGIASFTVRPTFAGATPWDSNNFDKTTTLIAVQGTFKNLSSSATGTNANVSLSADEIILENSATNLYVTARSVALAINSAATGANGLDTGTLAASTWYSVWVIWNGTTVSGLLSLSATAPTLPSGYTHKARTGWIFTDSTANKYPLSYVQRGRDFQYKVAGGTNVTVLPVLASGVQGTVGSVGTQVLGAGLPWPTTAWKVRLVFFVSPSCTAQVSPNSNMSLSPGSPALSLATGNGTQNVAMDLVLEAQSVYYAGNGGSNICTVSTYGWQDNL